MESEASDRLQAELDLLFAMYPDSLSYSPKARELKYTHDHHSSASLLLRLPETYPLEGAPEVISAVGPCKEDLRSATKETFLSIDGEEEEEVLDALILGFRDLVSSREVLSSKDDDLVVDRPGRVHNRTVVIWLHHLLNTNKRKLALSAAGAISGVTKPGYPGVLVFAGEKSAVDSHVAELRNQKWQAFQIRYDVVGDAENSEGRSEAWRFKHGVGICEADSMSDLVQDILDPEHKDIFVRCVGIK
ncbi:hypothetical protein GGS20DRAFT_557869 [Poronia punctata]|nr:hypothetical protein GGS20DRAFT_557869 [Poronia punctata]